MGVSAFPRSGHFLRSMDTTGIGESRGGISPPRAPRTVREPLDSYGSRCSAIGTSNGSASSTRLLPLPVGPWPRLNNAAPSVQPHYRAFRPTTSCSVPVLRVGTLILTVCAAWISPLASERQVLAFRTRAWLRVAPPTYRMPFGQAPGSPRADPEGMASPRFWHRLIRFRHFIGGLLALASLNLACRSHAPTFPQRSPPSLLTTAACGGLRPVPDHRPRRALLHLSYSCAPPTHAALVTHRHIRTLACQLNCTGSRRR
jgi:hypothetical protein